MPLNHRIPSATSWARPTGRSGSAAWFVSAGLALLVLLFGAWLRLDQFAAQTLLDDEWHAVHQVVRSDPAHFLLTHGADDHSIALTLLYWVQAQTIGLSELGMRLPLMLAGIASLLVLPLVLRGSLSPRVPLIFALLLALSPLLVNYSKTARPYALTLLLTFTGFAVLARAVAGDRVRWGLATLYAGLAALSVWLPAVTLPLVVAPLLALAVSRKSGRGELSWPSLLGLASLVLLVVALALLPPMINDASALAAKAGRDLPRLSTLIGVWHVWLGTSSSSLVLVSLLLAALGAGPVWRGSRVARWALLGLLLTLGAILVVRPAWVFNPLTFGRYLLPALPLLLLAIATGMVRLIDIQCACLPARVGARAQRLLPMTGALALGVWGWHTSVHPALLRHPNSNALHYYFQFDYRPQKNPVVEAFDAIRPPAFWPGLKALPAGSVTVALAPFRFDSGAWLGPAWESASHQRVIPGFLSGACGPWFFGEVPPDARFALRNAVHLSDAAALLRKRVDYVAFDRRFTVLDAQGVKRAAPECEAWMLQRFGRPFFEDAEMIVWRSPTPPP